MNVRGFKSKIFLFKIFINLEIILEISPNNLPLD
jgi:hypothetical protein